MSEKDEDCVVVWIYRFMIIGSVSRNKLIASCACVWVKENDEGLGGIVTELNPKT